MHDFLLNLINSLNGLSGMQTGTLALVVEWILHKIPSEKPLGVVYGIKNILRGGVSLLNDVEAAISSVADLLDKILPQNIKPVEPPK